MLHSSQQSLFKEKGQDQLSIVKDSHQNILQTRESFVLLSYSLPLVSITSLGNFVHVTLFFFSVFVFSIREVLQLILKSPLFYHRNLFSTGEGLELDKTMKEWCCVVLHAKKHYGQCIGFAVLSLTWSLKTAGHIVFLRVGFLGPWQRLRIVGHLHCLKKLQICSIYCFAYALRSLDFIINLAIKPQNRARQPTKRYQCYNSC